jgi:hypothetical protein
VKRLETLVGAPIKMVSVEPSGRDDHALIKEGSSVFTNQAPPRRDQIVVHAMTFVTNIATPSTDPHPRTHPLAFPKTKYLPIVPKRKPSKSVVPSI